MRVRQLSGEQSHALPTYVAHAGGQHGVGEGALRLVPGAKKGRRGGMREADGSTPAGTEEREKQTEEGTLPATARGLPAGGRVGMDGQRVVRRASFVLLRSSPSPSCCAAMRGYSGSCLLLVVRPAKHCIPVVVQCDENVRTLGFGCACCNRLPWYVPQIDKPHPYNSLRVPLFPTPPAIPAVHLDNLINLNGKKS